MAGQGKNALHTMQPPAKTLRLTPSERQREFLMAKTRFVAYGGARGGGKSWAVRCKAVLMALKHNGIRILILRRTLPELRENHILPLQEMLAGIATYKDTDKSFSFPTGARIRFGYCDAEADVHQYQGQEYDVIFMDEATHFTEYQFSCLTACLRGTNNLPKRFYVTCNPGGVGHAWVKRLFIDKQYTAAENPEDYTFIPAKVYDNTVLMRQDPMYAKGLEALPEDQRRAWLNGDWDVFAGQFFPEFRREVHVVRPFEIPDHWTRMCALDYGLDMLAVLWAAIDERGRGVVYREVHESGLIISQAAALIKPYLKDTAGTVFAPHDLWGRSADTGKSQAERFYEEGINLLRVKAMGRVDGWLAIKEWLAVDAEGRPGLQIFDTCVNLAKNLPQLTHDDRNPNDVSINPHEITHAPDALRYLLAGRPIPARVPVTPQHFDFEVLKPKPSPVGRGDRVMVV